MRFTASILIVGLFIGCADQPATNMQIYSSDRPILEQEPPEDLQALFDPSVTVNDVPEINLETSGWEEIAADTDAAFKRNGKFYDELVKDFDKNRDGSPDLDKWRAYKDHRWKVFDGMYWDYVKKLKAKYDSNGDGELTRRELQFLVPIAVKIYSLDDRSERTPEEKLERSLLRTKMRRSFFDLNSDGHVDTVEGSLSSTVTNHLYNEEATDDQPIYFYNSFE